MLGLLVITSAVVSGLIFTWALSRPAIYRQLFFARIWVACVIGGAGIWAHMTCWAMLQGLSWDVSLALLGIYVCFGGPFIAWQIGMKQGEDTGVASRKASNGASGAATTPHQGGSGSR